ncbi:15231_t:CDS:2, partial [Entrophospora sp. SA101]
TEINIINQKQEIVGNLPLNSEVWQSPYSAHAVSLVVRSYLANQRQATSKVKSRGEVKGSTRKIYRQKGTGGARHGSRYAPQFRGGGISFGPTGQENYHCQINKKVRKKALQSVLSKKNAKGEIMVIDKINLSEYKTKEANKFLTQLKLNAKKVLIIFSTQESKNEATKRAFRNLPKIAMTNSKIVNTYAMRNIIRQELIHFSAKKNQELRKEIQQKNQELRKTKLCDQIIITGLEAKDYRNIDLDHPVVFTPKQLVGNEYSLKAKNASLWEKFRSTSYSTIDNEIKPGEIDQAQKEKKITID